MLKSPALPSRRIRAIRKKGIVKLAAVDDNDRWNRPYRRHRLPVPIVNSVCVETIELSDLD